MTNTSGNPMRQFLVNNTIRLMVTIRRHLLPICLTTVFILGAWMVITLPMIGVFIIDGAFTISEYVSFVFYAAGVSLAISAIIMFPLNLLVEWLAAPRKILIVLIPACLLAISGICLIRQFLLTGASLDTMFSWAIKLVAFSLVFTVYWSSLWLGQVVIYGFHKLIKSISAGAQRA